MHPCILQIVHRHVQTQNSNLQAVNSKKKEGGGGGGGSDGGVLVTSKKGCKM